MSLSVKARTGTRPGRHQPDPLQRYSLAASAGSVVIIRRYSTSFSLACRLLPRPVRQDIANVYALVRLADEVVDGAAAHAGFTAEEVLACLDGLERETLLALDCGYSANPVVHAFAGTARRTGIDPSLVTPFFASMRRDCVAAPHTAESVETYIYGSAEVVGLMCLRVFLSAEDAHASTAGERWEELAEPARRLGAAFQKVNFLRDLYEDTEELGRGYFPGVAAGAFNEEQKRALVDGVRADLQAALPGVRRLPASCRKAVELAYALFSALTDRLAATPAEVVAHERVRVPGREKACLAGAVLLGLGPARGAGREVAV
ncbi:phytoene synthase [Arthrobacter woluwensis]|uniref:phytoene/squalene synthase family protein n=1 Tax=Arthrobacter woluwensis TaxID=156980 RepID=UPI0027872244|nr:phytoene/squalene synthase family protein [Arthrobacter woluwensis]MDQ0708798.1 phytoene synthase [Arthrobacter woluwensis]